MAIWEDINKVTEPLNKDIHNFAASINESNIGRLLNQGIRAVQDSGADYAIPAAGPITGLTKAVTRGIFGGWLADLLNVGRTGKRLQLPNWHDEFLRSLFDVARGTENLLGARHVRIL